MSANSPMRAEMGRLESMSCLLKSCPVLIATGTTCSDPDKTGLTTTIESLPRIRSGGMKCEEGAAVK